MLYNEIRKKYSEIGECEKLFFEIQLETDLLFFIVEIFN
jgi:hypothetical protein